MTWSIKNGRVHTTIMHSQTIDMVRWVYNIYDTTKPKIIRLLYLFNGKNILCVKFLLFHTTDENCHVEFFPNYGSYNCTKHKCLSDSSSLLHFCNKGHTKTLYSVYFYVHWYKGIICITNNCLLIVKRWGYKTKKFYCEKCSHENF